MSRKHTTTLENKRHNAMSSALLRCTQDDPYSLRRLNDLTLALCAEHKLGRDKHMREIRDILRAALTARRTPIEVRLSGPTRVNWTGLGEDGHD